MNIGDWIRRHRRVTWHKVESVIANDAVTKCGRRMADEANTRGALDVYRPSPRVGTIPMSNRCMQCLA